METTPRTAGQRARALPRSAPAALAARMPGQMALAETAVFPLQGGMRPFRFPTRPSSSAAARNVDAVRRAKPRAKRQPGADDGHASAATSGMGGNAARGASDVAGVGTGGGICGNTGIGAASAANRTATVIAEASGPQSPAQPRPRVPWPDLAPLVDGRPAGRLPLQQTKLWSLVLRARRVPHRVRSLPGGYTVQVPPRFIRQAVEEILLYQQENVSPHPSIPLPPPQERARPTVAAMLALCAFFALTHRPWPGLGWYPQYWRAVGVADAAAMVHGELWRAFTALTLHADPAHVASNAVVGGAFLILLSRRVGSGWAWLAAVLAGALGNGVNALVHAALDGPGHLSVGFSTAVFGVAGVLAGLKAAHGGDDDLRARAGEGGRDAIRGRENWLIPVAAGLALVATLGTAGEDTDLGAHFFGLLAGLGLGGGLGRLALRLGRPDDWAAGRANLAAGALAWALLAGAWTWGWLAGWPLAG